MIPAGTGIRNYRNVKLFDRSDNDLDVQMEEILERRREEREAELALAREPFMSESSSILSDSDD